MAGPHVLNHLRTCDAALLPLVHAALIDSITAAMSQAAYDAVEAWREKAAAVADVTYNLDGPNVPNKYDLDAWSRGDKDLAPPPLLNETRARIAAAIRALPVE